MSSYGATFRATHHRRENNINRWKNDEFTLVSFRNWARGHVEHRAWVLQMKPRLFLVSSTGSNTWN